MSGTNQLLEFVQSEKLPADRIDREKGCLRGVRLLGERSANAPPFNHVYPRSTREAALYLFEGVRVNCDHPDPDKASQTRSVRDGMGFITNVREAGDGLYGDWHFNPAHELAANVCWEAANNPRGIAFSINGQSGSKRRSDDGMIVEAIDALSSVDLVSRGATTNGLFESQRPVMKMSIRDLIEHLKYTRPGYARGLREVAESGLMTPDQQADAPLGDAPPDAPGDEPGDADHEVALKQGFRGAMLAVIDDDSMDMGGKIGKLKEIMKAQEKLMSGAKGGKGGKGAECPPGDPGAKGGKGADEPDADDKKKDAMESLRLQNRALHLLMESGIRPDRVLSKALEGCKNEAEIKELIEAGRSRGQTTYNGARSASAGTSAAATVQEGAIPATGADWAKTLLE